MSGVSESQIKAMLKQADAGVPVKDIGRSAGLSMDSDSLSKSQYAGTMA